MIQGLPTISQDEKTTKSLQATDVDTAARQTHGQT
jgi:hypothetical protein